MCCVCDCWGDFPLSAWLEEYFLAVRFIMRSSKRTKCISGFGELWYVKPPPPSFPCSHLLLLFLSFFCPQAFFHPLVCFVDLVYKTNLLFPNHSRAFWAVKVSLLPNMHEIVTVCLEAVCWACKFKPQSKDQRQMVKSSQSERPSWLFKSDDWISTLNLVHNGNTGKNTTLVFNC